MSVRFSAVEMGRELTVLSTVARGFLESQSASRLETLGRRLILNTTEANKGGDQEFDWDTREAGTDVPLRTVASTSYKGLTADHKPLYAEIRFSWRCRAEAGEKVRVREGVVVVSMSRDGSNSKTIHFDVSKGGHPQGSGHPPFHAQFYGCVNDIPRLPFFIVSPVDVIDFILLELFQEKWRAHLNTSKTRTQLRTLPKQQRTRAINVLTNWCNTIRTSSHSQLLVALQAELQVPLEMC